MLSKGFLYIAIGKKNFQQALESIKSLQNVCPDAKICLYSTETFSVSTIQHFQIALNASVVKRKGKKQVDIINSSKYLAMQYKSSLLSLSPYDLTAFLDTDTFIRSNEIVSPFAYLEDYDLVIKKSPMPTIRYFLNRYPKLKNHKLNWTLSHYSSGVIYFVQSPIINKLNLLWQKYWFKFKNIAPPDQFSLALAISTLKNLKIKQLSPIYNTSKREIKKFKKTSIVYHYQNNKHLFGL